MPLQADAATSKDALGDVADLDAELREQSEPLVMPVGRVSIAKVSSRFLPTRTSYVEMTDHQDTNSTP